MAMVVAGHSSHAVANLFAPGGMSISLLAGVLYAATARSSLTGDATGGAIAGGVCALLGILVSYLLGDVRASILIIGTISSVVTGAIGGAIGYLIFPRSRGAGRAAPRST
jgi:hypothetical protein